MYLRGLLIEAVAKPTAEQVLARARARVTVTGSELDVDAILGAVDADRRRGISGDQR